MQNKHKTFQSLNKQHIPCMGSEDTYYNILSITKSVYLETGVLIVPISKYFSKKIKICTIELKITINESKISVINGTGL